MSRPRIQITLSFAGRVSEWTGVVLLVGIWTLACYQYATLPAVIPIHFNITGNADAYGSKATLWLLPAIATSVYTGLTVLSRYPHMFNYPLRITERNAQRQYSIAIRMLRQLKLSVLFVFTAMLLMTGDTEGQGVAWAPIWLLPLLLLLISVPVIYAVMQMLKEDSKAG